MWVIKKKRKKKEEIKNSRETSLRYRTFNVRGLMENVKRQDVFMIIQAWWRQWFTMWKERLLHLAQKNLMHSLHYHDYTSGVSPLSQSHPKT
jgi:hypothetical protein